MKFCLLSLYLLQFLVDVNCIRESANAASEANQSLLGEKFIDPINNKGMIGFADNQSKSNSEEICEAMSKQDNDMDKYNCIVEKITDDISELPKSDQTPQYVYDDLEKNMKNFDFQPSPKQKTGMLKSIKRNIKKQRKRQAGQKNDSSKQSKKSYKRIALRVFKNAKTRLMNKCTKTYERQIDKYECLRRQITEFTKAVTKQIHERKLKRVIILLRDKTTERLKSKITELKKEGHKQGNFYWNEADNNPKDDYDVTGDVKEAEWEEDDTEVNSQDTKFMSYEIGEDLSKKIDIQSDNIEQAENRMNNIKKKHREMEDKLMKALSNMKAELFKMKAIEKQRAILVKERDELKKEAEDQIELQKNKYEGKKEELEGTLRRIDKENSKTIDQLNQIKDEQLKSLHQESNELVFEGDEIETSFDKVKSAVDNSWEDSLG